MVPYLVWLCFAGALNASVIWRSIRRPTPSNWEFEPMQTDNKLFEDLSKVATSALGTIAGVTREVERRCPSPGPRFRRPQRCDRS